MAPARRQSINPPVQFSAASGPLLLMPLNAEKTDPLVQPFKARLKVVDRRGMVYVGTEDIWKRKHREVQSAGPVVLAFSRRAHSVRDARSGSPNMAPT